MAMHRKTLRDNGIKLVSAKENIPDSPEGIILESLLEGMAEYYSAELSQKVLRGMRESRIKGNYTGGFLLFGYKVENKKKSLLMRPKLLSLNEFFKNMNLVNA
jgi:DNA invertase Pin-like site-specific DNA recombinase